MGNALLHIGDEITVIAAEDRGYFPHDVCLLHDGTLVAAVNDRATHMSFDGKICLLYSRDGGRTWGEYVTLQEAAVPNLDYRDPSITALSDGTLLVTYFQWMAHIHHGQWDGAHNFVLRSTDGGQTWEGPVAMDTAPYAYATCTERCVELPSGRVLMPMQAGCSASKQWCSAVYMSDDRGLTWRHLSTVIDFDARDGDIFSTETAITRTATGALLAVARGRHHMYAGLSQDDGLTWESWPMPDTAGNTQPSLNTLSDGRILLCYGDRGPYGMKDRLGYPFSIVARLSEDEGRSFAQPIRLREFLPHPDMGYPTSVELRPGVMLTMYWRSEPAHDPEQPKRLKYALSARIWEVPSKQAMREVTCS